MPQESYSEGVGTVAPQAAVTPRQQIQTNPTMFGGAVASGEQALAAGAEKAGNFWGEVQTDAALNDSFSKASDTVSEYRRLNGKDALDQRQDYEDRLNQTFTEAREQLPSPLQKERFDQQARAFRERYIQGMVNTHADEQARAFTKAQNDATHALGLNTIASAPNDDSAFSSGLDLMMKGKVRNLEAAGLAGDPTIHDVALNEVAIDATEARVKALIVSPNIEDKLRAKTIFETNRPLLAKSKNYDAFSNYIEGQVDKATADVESEKYLRGAAPTGQGPVPAPSANNLGNVKTVSAAAAGTQEYQHPETPVDGVILAANNLRESYGGLSIMQIAEKWAPKEDGNDPAAWARNVSSASGLPTSAVPDLNDPSQLQSLLRGISVAEKSPAQRVAFNDAVLREGVEASLSGQSPKLTKAQMLLDEAGMLAKIDQDYQSDPRMGHLISAQVKSRFAEARMASQAQTLARADANDKALREAGDNIRANPDFNVNQWLAQHPDLPEQQAEHLISLSQQAMDERLHGKPGDYGPKAYDVLQRILNPSQPGGILHQEQLNAIAADPNGGLNNSGWKWASQALVDAHREGAEGEREMLSTFWRDARSAVTMYDGVKDLIPGQTEVWDKAQPVLNAAMTDARARGVPLTQMLARDGNKESVWKILDQAPYKLNTAQIVSGQINRDAQAAAGKSTAIQTVGDLQGAIAGHRITFQDAAALVQKHPEWGIRLRSQEASGPQVPVQ